MYHCSAGHLRQHGHHPVKQDGEFFLYRQFLLSVTFCDASWLFHLVVLMQIKNGLLIGYSSPWISLRFVSSSSAACVHGFQSCRYIHFRSWAKWLTWLLTGIVRFHCLPPSGPKKTLPTWQDCSVSVSVTGSLYQCTRTAGLSLAAREEHGQLQRSCSHHASLHYIWQLTIYDNFSNFIWWRK